MLDGNVVMIIPGKIFRVMGIVIPIVVLPLVMLDIFEPDGRIGHILHVCSFPFLLVIGLSGALAAILERAGVIEFRYTEDDKKRFHFRMARNIAEQERNAGHRFSRRYYQSYGITHPDDETAA